MHSLFGIKHVILIAASLVLVAVLYLLSRRMSFKSVTRYMLLVGIVSEIIKIFYYTVANEDAHGGILPKTDLFIQRAVKTALSIIALGMFFSLDFYIEYYNVIPDTLCAIFVIAGICLLRKYITNVTPVIWAAAGYGVMTLVSSALTIWFNTQYYFNAIYKDAAAELVFLGAGMATILENILFLLRE